MAIKKTNKRVSNSIYYLRGTKDIDDLKRNKPLYIKPKPVHNAHTVHNVCPYCGCTHESKSKYGFCGGNCYSKAYALIKHKEWFLFDKKKTQLRNNMIMIFEMLSPSLDFVKLSKMKKI